MRKIDGKSVKPCISHLEVNGNHVTSKPEIVQSLAQALYDKCSGNSYDPDFTRRKVQIEEQPLQFNIDDVSNYNDDITMAELQKAISRTGNSSPGPDGIPYIVLRNLPLPTLRVLLALYNRIWSDGTFPSIWHDAHVICIPKPNKDSSNPLNYRPISLTNCLCKILERIVCNRLTFHLENNGLLHDMQSGFRCGRSTTDHLVTLETFIREALVAKQHTLSVFFDVEAAYDRCWKYGALRDLHRLGIRGRLPIFIANFLQDRRFKVRLGSHFSDWFPQKEGFPQGSLLSILLFIVQMDGLKRSLPQNSRDVLASLYVDDLAISVRSRNLATAEKTLQNIINNVNRWAVSNGMKFSSTKSVCGYTWE